MPSPATAASSRGSSTPRCCAARSSEATRRASRGSILAPMGQPRSLAEQTKFLLDESQIPRHWYNIRADMPSPPQPVLHPGTGQPVGPDDLAPLFPMELILQEVSEEPEVAIPEEILDIYSLWRPTPIDRDRRPQTAIGTRPPNSS